MDADITSKEENISSNDVSDSSSISSKRRRTGSSSPLPSEEFRVTSIYWDYSHTCSTHPDRLNKWEMGAKFMDTSTIVGPGQAVANQTSFSLEDWEDLRDLATEAQNTYDGKLRPMICSICCSLSQKIIYLVPFVSCARLSMNVTAAWKFTRILLLSLPLPCIKKRWSRLAPPAPLREWYNDPQDTASERGRPGQPILPLQPLSDSTEDEEW